MYIIESNMCTILNPLQPSNFNNQADVIIIWYSKSETKDVFYIKKLPLLHSICYQQKKTPKNQETMKIVIRSSYNNMTLFFCSDLGYQKLVISIAKNLHKDYITADLHYSLQIVRKLYYLDSQWLKSAATPGVCTMS